MLSKIEIYIFVRTNKLQNIDLNSSIESTRIEQKMTPDILYPFQNKYADDSA